MIRSSVVLIVGAVGSGKSTLLARLDPAAFVKLSPGAVCRAAVGDQYFEAGTEPNAPDELDDFVYEVVCSHLRLAVGIGRTLAVEWPRAPRQADRLNVGVENGTWAELDVIRLVYIEPPVFGEWERFMEVGRWTVRPETEAVDRARFSDSVRDAFWSLYEIVGSSVSWPFTSLELLVCKGGATIQPKREYDTDRYVKAHAKQLGDAITGKRPAGAIVGTVQQPGDCREATG